MVKTTIQVLAGALAVAVPACMPAIPDTAGMSPVEDSHAAVSRLAEATTPGHPQTIRFDWTIDEPDLRARGAGVLRTEAPERLRLDLFGPRGDTYLVAALVHDRFRLPETAAAIELPPAPLFWAALGVVRPPADAEVEVFQEVDGDGWSVRFTTADGVVRVSGRAAGDGPIVESAALERDGRILATVSHASRADGAPERSVYHDRTEARRLTFEFTRVERSDPFSPDTWRPFE